MKTKTKTPDDGTQMSTFKRLRSMPEFNLVLIWLVFTIALSVINPTFISAGNITNLLRSTAIVGILAIGMTFVIITGGIDLSVGSTLAFSGMLAAILMDGGMGVAPAIIIGVVAGTLVGVIQGLIIHYGNVPAFIATLGGMAIIRGVVMLMSNANKVLVPSSVGQFAVLKLFGIPAMVYVWLVIVVVGIVIAKYTIFGRNVYAIGSDQEAARLSGIKISKNICYVYAFSAFCASVAGILMLTRLGSGTPTAGTSYEMDAVAAAVVGGASLSGAVGSVFGTVVGTVIIAMISNGGQLLGINSFILDIAVGALIVIAVFIDKKSKKGGR